MNKEELIALLRKWADYLEKQEHVLVVDGNEEVRSNRPTPIGDDRVKVWTTRMVHISADFYAQEEQDKVIKI